MNIREKLQSCLAKQGITKQFVDERAGILYKPNNKKDNPVPEKGDVVKEYVLSCNKFTTTLVTLNSIVYNHCKGLDITFSPYQGYAVEYAFENFNRLPGSKNIVEIVEYVYDGSSFKTSRESDTCRHLLQENLLNGRSEST